MHNPDLYPQHIRQHLVALYQQRPWGVSNYAARTRLYGDAFTDALAKHGYLDGGLSLTSLFWLPQCISLHNVGIIAEPASREDIVTKGLLLLQRLEWVWGRRPFAVCLREVVAGYYAHFDGAGVPRGIRGSDIPLAARIAAVVAEYAQWMEPSELVSDTHQHTHALTRLRERAGTRFDPQLVEVFQSLSPALAAINRRFETPGAPLQLACA